MSGNILVYDDYMIITRLPPNRNDIKRNSIGCPFIKVFTFNTFIIFYETNNDGYNETSLENPILFYLFGNVRDS